MITESRTVRVLIADDQTLFRDGMAELLKRGDKVELVGEASNGAEAVKKALALKPDVVLMDLRMPEVDGVEATRRIRTQCPNTRVLVLSMFETDKYVVDALRSGASGYVLKDTDAGAIVSSIMTVMAGGRVMAESVADRVLDMATGSDRPDEKYDGLTPREVEILKLVAAGTAVKHIGYQLKISEKTVRNHLSNIYQKLQIYDRGQAILYALRKGLVEL